MKLLAICTSAAVAMYALSGCSKEPLTIMAPPPAVALAVTTDSVFVFENNVDKNLLLELINNVRAKGCNCGATYMPPVPPVTWNEKLEKASWLHSKEMSDSNYMSHTGKNGGNGGDRIKKMGYNWKVYRENLALGVLTEKTVIEGWMRSETHCLSMMDANVKETAVAKFSHFWTQELAVKK